MSEKKYDKTKQALPFMSNVFLIFYILSIKTRRKNVKKKTKIFGQMIKYMLSF